MKARMIAFALVLFCAAQADSLNCREVGAYTLNQGLGVEVDPGRNLAYLGSQSEVSVLDIANPAHPTKRSRVEASGMIDCVCPRSDRLYIPEMVYGLLEIWDVAVPDSPVRLNDYHTGGFPNGVGVEGSYAYVSDGVANLLVIDVSDPESLHEEGRCRLSDAPGRVALAGSYAYVTLGVPGLSIIDVSDPDSSHEVGFCPTPGSARDVAVAGNYAYVADCDYGLRIIDVSDPQSPTEAGYYYTPGYALDVAVAGSYAYVADNNAGLRVIDVSDPDSSHEVGFYDTPGWAEGVAVAGSYAYVAASTAGLRIIEFYGGSGAVEEGPGADALVANPGPTVVRGVLFLAEATSRKLQAASLLDATGRCVAALHAGTNDLSGFAPGVYFVKVESGTTSLTRKLVID